MDSDHFETWHKKQAEKLGILENRHAEIVIASIVVSQVTGFDFAGVYNDALKAIFKSGEVLNMVRERESQGAAK